MLLARLTSLQQGISKPGFLLELEQGKSRSRISPIACLQLPAAENQSGCLSHQNRLNIQVHKRWI